MATQNPLPRDRFALLFAVMLVAASGNTAMQSLMPAIGRELHIAGETARAHIRNAMRKLAADTRTHAVAMALRQSLIE